MRQGESAVEKSNIVLNNLFYGAQIEAENYKRAIKQREALQSLKKLLEKDNNAFNSAIWSALKSKGWAEEIERKYAHCLQ